MVLTVLEPFDPPRLEHLSDAAALLPPDVFLGVARSGEPAGRLWPEEAALLHHRAVAKRREDFRLGREAARRALAQLNFPPLPILRGPLGEPLWPSGVAGSISHSRGLAAAVAASDDFYAGLGLDLEDAAPLGLDAAEHLVCLPQELAWVHAEPASGSRRLRLSAIFSAKESVYKAVYGAAGRTLTFADAMIRCAANGLLSADVVPDLPGCRGRQLPGWCFLFESWLLTVVLMPRADPGDGD